MTTRKPNKTQLEFSVEGNQIGELTMYGRGNGTNVSGGNVLRTGIYSSDFQGIEDMALTKLGEEYPREKIKIDLK